jgi:hypothetical protein
MTVNLRGCSAYQAMPAGIDPRPARDYAPGSALGLPCADYSETGAGVKARQSSKIKELGDALIAIGFLSLDHQATALGLARSTTWTILKANHKGSGLSATVINRMLATPQLPPLVRAIILEYIDEKKAGLYGHSKIQLRRFAARLAVERGGPARRKSAEYREMKQPLRPVPRALLTLHEVLE